MRTANPDLLPRYSDWSPTPFDPKGYALDEEERGAWLVGPTCPTRDSGPLALANHAAALAACAKVDPDGVDHEEHSFGHWGPGYFSIILTRPGSRAADALAECAAALADYPVLDDDELATRESEERAEAWSNYARAEYARMLEKRLGVDVSDVSDEALRALFGERWSYDGDSAAALDERDALQDTTTEEARALPGARWSEALELDERGEPTEEALDELDARPARAECERVAESALARRGHTLPRYPGRPFVPTHYARSVYTCPACGARATVNVRPAPGAPVQARFFGPALDAPCSAPRPAPY